MPYKIYKTVEDNRNHTCGFVIPNGGWYHIVEMTFENHKQLTNIGMMPGYSVDFVQGNIGMFDPDGNEVDPMTVEVHRITKQVIGYETVNKTRAGKETPVKANLKEGERDTVLAECQRRGIKVDQRWSTQKIKDALATSQTRVESTLAIQ
jgi:hypothetical protein